MLRAILEWAADHRLDEHISAVACSFLLAMPLTGFVAGATLCKNCNNVGEHLLMGFINAVIATLSLGHIWLGDKHFVGVWHFILPTAVVLWVLFAFRLRRISLRQVQEKR
jgi:hypothetical protein